MSGKELKEKRNELNFTQEQLAKELQVTANTVARWERDEMKIPPFLHLALETVKRKISSRSQLDLTIPLSVKLLNK